MQVTIFTVSLIAFFQMLGEQFSLILMTNLIHHLRFAQMSLPRLVPGAIVVAITLLLSKK